MESTDSGILIPRVALSATDNALPVVSPNVSELIYNTATAGTSPNNVSPGFYYWNGSLWVGLSAGSLPGGDDKWDLSGNAGTDPGTNFMGTTDDKALHFKTNNTTRLTIPSANQIYANSRGTAAAPFYSFADDNKMGLYSPAANFLDFATDGKLRFRIGHDFNGNTSTNYIASYLNHRFADGDPSKPSITFRNQSNMGLYKAASHVIGFSSKGVERMRISDNGVRISGSLSLKEGTQLTLSDGLNNPISLGTAPFSQYRIVGPTSAFTIGGIVPIADADGQMITLINTTSLPFTILNNHPATNQDQRVYCPGERDFVLTGRYSTVTLQYNATLQKWVLVDYVGENANTDSPYGSNMQSVKGTTDTSMNSVNFTDMQDMTLTFTPTHSTVFVSFSASGFMNVSGTMPENGGAAFRLINVTASNSVEAGFATLATDYDSDTYNGNFYEAVISAWSVGLNMFPVTVNPGESTTLKIQWAREAVAYAQELRCNVASDPSGAHRALTVFD